MKFDSQTAAFTLRNSYGMIKFGVNQLMRLMNVEMTVTKTVRELIFDGYDDPFLRFINHIPLVSKPPFKQFAWFVNRNNSWRYDGHFEMRSGVADINQLGLLTKWNYSNKTKYHQDKCSHVNGSTGELWPMNMNATGDITIFVTDLCRPLTLAYQREHKLFGLTGNRWIGDYRVFDNGEKYPPNSCYGAKKSFPDLKTGVHDLSSCRYGAPVFASFPHFYLADRAYVDAVTGLRPSQREHEFSMALEPSTGVPLNVDAKIQISALIQPIKGFT